MIDNKTKTLQDLSKGDMYSYDFVFNAIIEGKRIRHVVIENLVKSLKEKNLTDTEILDLLLIMDKGVETGELTESDLIFNK